MLFDILLQSFEFLIRVVGCHDVTRAREIWPFNVVASVSQCLSSDFEELIKATVKFLATFSALICNYDLADQVQVRHCVSPWSLDRVTIMQKVVVYQLIWYSLI